MRDSIDIPIDERTRAQLEEAGGITLTDTQCEALRAELEEYALMREAELAVRPNDRLRKHYEKVQKNARALIASLGDLDRKLNRPDESFDAAIAMNDEILFDSAVVDERIFLHSLSQIDRCLEARRLSRIKGGRPRDLWLTGLLHFLAGLYLDAGGHSTGVSKLDQRKSIFIDFAWVAVQLLPKKTHPHSPQALAALWERCRSKSEGATEKPG